MAGPYHTFAYRRGAAGRMLRSNAAGCLQALRICVDRCFPTAGGKLNKAKACMFTNTPDSNFILDFHPQHKQVCVRVQQGGRSRQQAVACILTCWCSDSLIVPSALLWQDASHTWLELPVWSRHVHRSSILQIWKENIMSCVGH